MDSTVVFFTMMEWHVRVWHDARWHDKKILGWELTSKYVGRLASSSAPQNDCGQLGSEKVFKL